MLVVADASALLALVACGSLHLLDAIFGEVRIPTAVFDEVVVEGQPGAATLRMYLVGKVVAADPIEQEIRASGLGRGELEAMALYRALGADLLLVDDRRARQTADRYEIEVIGSAGFLLLGKRRGLIPEVKPLLTAMRAAGIYVGQRVEARILRLAGEE